MATTPKALTQAEGSPARLGGRPFIHLRWPFFVGFLVLAIKELDFLGDHLGAIVLYLALIFPRAIMKPPFNVDHLPLRKMLVTDLCQFIPRNDGMPRRLFVVRPALIFPAAVCCHGKVRHCCALRGIVHLGVTAEPSDEHNLINHRDASFSFFVGTIVAPGSCAGGVLAGSCAPGTEPHDARRGRGASARTPVSSRQTADAGTRVGCSFCVTSSLL